MSLRRIQLLLGLPAAWLCSAALLLPAAQAQYNGNLNTQEQRIYDYGPGGSNGSSKGGSILDSANPLDLMNKLKRGTAMDDATNPTDAVDAALKALEAQAPATVRPGSSGAASQVKKP